jgi:hypothetical protein
MRVPERASLWEAGAAVREALFGNATAAKERASDALKLSHDREVEYGAALAFAISDDSLLAQGLADEMEKRFPEDSSLRFNYLPTIRACLPSIFFTTIQCTSSAIKATFMHRFAIVSSCISTCAPVCLDDITPSTTPAANGTRISSLQPRETLGELVVFSMAHLIALSGQQNHF